MHVKLHSFLFIHDKFISFCSCCRASNLERRISLNKEYRLDQTPCVWLKNNLWPMDGLLCKKQDVFTEVYSFKLLITRAE